MRSVVLAYSGYRWCLCFFLFCNISVQMVPSVWGVGGSKITEKQLVLSYLVSSLSVCLFSPIRLEVPWKRDWLLLLRPFITIALSYEKWPQPLKLTHRAESHPSKLKLFFQECINMLSDNSTSIPSTNTDWTSPVSRLCPDWFLHPYLLQSGLEWN